MNRLYCGNTGIAKRAALYFSCYPRTSDTDPEFPAVYRIIPGMPWGEFPSRSTHLPSDSDFLFRLIYRFRVGFSFGFGG